MSRAKSGLWMSCAVVVVCLGCLGCKEQREDAQKAVAVAKALTDLAQQGKAAEKAAKEAEKAARDEIPEGTDPEVAKQQVELAKGVAAMKALAGGGGGPAVNWRQLAPLLPEALGDFKAKGELDGSTKKMGGFEVSEVKRRYDAGGRELRVEITDATAHALLRAPFAMVAMIEEDSTAGFKKGKTIGGHPGVVEWKEKSKQGNVSLLVAQRFVVNVRIAKAQSSDEAETIASALKLDELAALATAAAPAEAAKN
jgi:hypothetical protein